MQVISGGLVVTADAARGEMRDIVVDGDIIADIVAPGTATNANAEVLDARRRLVIPGLINAHTHSHGGLSKGVGDLMGWGSSSMPQSGSAGPVRPTTSASPPSSTPSNWSRRVRLPATT